MIRRPRRTVPATVVAVVLLAACVVVAVAVIQSLLGQTPFVGLSPVLSFTSAQRWNSVVTIVVASVVVLLGLVLLLVALGPGTPTVLPLARLTDDDGAPVADAGVRRATLDTDLTAAAAGVTGVSSARVRTRRKRVTARIMTAAQDPDRVPDLVRERLTDRLREIAPAHTPTVRVRARRDRNT